MANQKFKLIKNCKKEEKKELKDFIDPEPPVLSTLDICLPGSDTTGNDVVMNP